MCDDTHGLGYNCRVCLLPQKCRGKDRESEDDLSHFPLSKDGTVESYGMSGFELGFYVEGEWPGK